MKKNITILSLLIMFITFVGSVQAADYNKFVDSSTSTEVYKFSEEKEINLPFLKFAAERMIMDTNISNVGIAYSQKNVDVEGKLSGMQMIYSAEIVRVTGEIDNTMIFADTVIIDGNVNGSVMIYSKNINITEKANINKDIICYSDTITIDGTIQGSLIGSIGKVIVNGSILRDLRVNTSQIEFKNSDNVKGVIYVETRNKELNISGLYPNSEVKFIEETVYSFDYIGVATVSIITALIAYLLISKTSLASVLLKRINENKIMISLSSILAIATLPLALLLVIILLTSNLAFIAIPFVLIYSSFFASIIAFSNIVLILVAFEYISKIYVDKFSKKTNKLILILVLSIIINTVYSLPTIGYYASIFGFMLSSGTVLTILIKKIKTKKAV